MWIKLQKLKLICIVIKCRLHYNIIKDLRLYEPRIISNYPWLRMGKEGEKKAALN